MQMAVRKDRDGKHKRRKIWLSWQVRAEKTLADAVTIDGRKEWFCKLCSETDVWTREMLQVLHEHPAREILTSSLSEGRMMFIGIIVFGWREQKVPQTQRQRFEICVGNSNDTKVLKRGKQLRENQQVEHVGSKKMEGGN